MTKHDMQEKNRQTTRELTKVFSLNDGIIVEFAPFSIFLKFFSFENKNKSLLKRQTQSKIKIE
jgi:hypothetical protein